MNKPKPLFKTETPPSPNKTNDMRYFLISYSFEDSFGNLFVESNKFPSKKELILHLKEKGKLTKGNIVIQNIFEFKSKEDYQKFTED